MFDWKIYKAQYWDSPASRLSGLRHTCANLQPSPKLKRLASLGASLRLWWPSRRIKVPNQSIMKASLKNLNSRVLEIKHRRKMKVKPGKRDPWHTGDRR